MPKIKTMLLPTGEFALILTGAGQISDAALETFKNFRIACGAAAGLATEFDVEVEDALIDENAVRANEVKLDFDTMLASYEAGVPNYFDIEGPNGKVITVQVVGDEEDDEDEDDVTTGPVHNFWTGPAFDFNEVRDSLARAFDRVTVQKREGDDLVEKAIEEGKDFSPAGLVVGGKTTAELEPELQAALDGRTPPAIDLEAESKFVEGQRVRIDFNVVESHYGTPLHEHLGRIASNHLETPEGVSPLTHFSEHDGETVVYWVALDSGVVVGIPAEDLTAVDEEE